MGKDKLRKFAENLTFECFVQPAFEEMFRTDHPLKGNWRKDFFKNDNPIVLELGCGKGEYTVGLARAHKDINYIGVDIKGSRMWVGLCQARNEGLTNVAFLRTHIELIDNFFAENEVDEVEYQFFVQKLINNPGIINNSGKNVDNSTEKKTNHVNRSSENPKADAVYTRKNTTITIAEIALNSGAFAPPSNSYKMLSVQVTVAPAAAIFATEIL